MQFYMVLTISFLSFARSDVVSSVQSLTNFFSVEEELAASLSQYLFNSEEKITVIRRFLEDIRQSSPVKDKQGHREKLIEKYVANPIQAYHLIKRLSTTWKNMTKIALDLKNEYEAIKEAIERSNTFGFDELSSETDLVGAATGLLRLKTAYDLEISDFIHGKLLHKQTTAHLSIEDCLYLARRAFELSEYSNSLEWCTQILKVILSPTSNLSDYQTKVFTEQLKSLMDDIQVTLNEKKSNSSPKQKSENKKVSNKSIKKVSNKTRPEQILRPSQYFITKKFHALCRGQQFLNASFISTLKCYYDTRSSPYFTLMPIKTEVLQTSPYIRIFHDVITDSEIEKIKKLSKHNLKRSITVGVNGSETSPIRTSATNFLADEVETTDLRRLVGRMTELTKLRVTVYDDSGERLQVVNYGLGGHYSPHYDCLKANQSPELNEKSFGKDWFENGDRMATLLFYLSDVELGGATAYPLANVAVFPRKGSAVFWYNLKKSGAADIQTMHGSCPTLLGSKWIMTKWILERQQFLRRPCGLSQQE